MGNSSLFGFPHVAEGNEDRHLKLDGYMEDLERALIS